MVAEGAGAPVEIPDRIEREILIEAPIETVWRVVTEPDQITQWFSDRAELELRVGGRGRLTWKSGASEAIRIQTIDPPRRFAFRWALPANATPTSSNSMLVEFTLSPEGTRTRLKVVESGFATIDWSDPDKAKYAREHNQGWDELMPRLQRVASHHVSAGRSE